MGISIIVGGQFGSEGKGKVSHWFAKKINASTVVRVGGTNSGHTVVDSYGNEHVFRVLPTSAIDNDKRCVISAGSYIDIRLLFQELEESGIDENNLMIDPNAVIITTEEMNCEQNSILGEAIGSTNSGTGAAVINRVSRSSRTLFAKDVSLLSKFIYPTKDYLRDEINNGHEIVIEGTQGFGLSNIHTPYYPFATSRDTSAAGFLSEIGLSPFDVSNIIMVIRSYPIRVGGNSGPLPNEISWEDVTANSCSNSIIREYTSVTKKLRRVASFDAEIVKNAIVTNKPNIIVLNHLDYVGDEQVDAIGKARRSFINNIQKKINRNIDYVGLSNSSVIPV